ncbi:hypothetical protein H072_9504 [Dactylellina haptotyla CBS 200.50]|uniref:NmrA-like domain-containing protein n=1 Tax=Dactylellina haptotyla (strain CBS 200.50) TaxID=1284197 RepID=S8A1P4_DACHA|nr:hypothetical protein H072_9504 [Dactylellina haptotyla CBS 200.50]
MASYPCPSILIIGHGELGLSVIESLHSSPSKKPLTSLTVLARPQTVSSLPKTDPAKYSMLDKRNVHWLPLDIETASLDDLKTAFKPFTAVIYASGMFAAAGTPTKVATAVRDAGVKYFIPWQFGVDYDVIGPTAAGGLFAEQYWIRKLLREENHGLKWNIISNGLFASFVFYEPFGIVNKEEGSVTALGGWDNKVTLTAAEDIGKVTAELVHERLNGKGSDGILYIAGETVTYGQIADTIQEKLGGQIERKVLDTRTVRDILERDPENKLAKYQLVFGEGNGCFWDSSTTYNEEKGVRMMKFREWMDTHEF